MSYTTKTSHPVARISIKANSDLPAYRFISYNGELCSTGDKSLGISDLEWNSGDSISVTVLGVMPVEIASPVNKGDMVTASTLGRAKTVATGEAINGRALDSATLIGQHIRVLLSQ